jgi:hypothetical protein
VKRKVYYPALLLLMILLVGCANKPPAETETAAAAETTVAATAETTEVTEPTEPSIANGMEFMPEENPGIGVETPYMTLYYPEEWQGIVTVKQAEIQKDYRLTFRTKAVQKDTELFSLLFSPSEKTEGFLIGSLTLEDGKVICVYAVMNEQLPENWSEEEVIRFSSMQERVNDLIWQLYEDPRFEPGK